MNLLKKTFLIFLFFLTAGLPLQASAFFNPADSIVLAQILAENVAQLVQLKKAVGLSQDTFKILDDINRNIDQALSLLETLNQSVHPGTFSEITNLSDLQSVIQNLYGTVPQGRYEETQKIHDKTVAESFKMHNDLYQYAKKLDDAGELIKNQAQNASPGRAQQLSAQNQGAILQALSQLQRNQAQIIKLLAEDVAMKNQKEKARAREHRYKYENLKNGFEKLKSDSYRLSTLN